MRTTKYEYICFMRWLRLGGYNPNTGKTEPISNVRQELWIKAFFRPDGVGNEFTPYQTDTASTITYYNEQNLGSLFVRDIPVWPAFTKIPIPNTNPVQYYKDPTVVPTNVYAWWPVQRPLFDASAIGKSQAANYNWVKMVGVSNTTVGTRFSKHYECKLATLTPADVVDAAIGYAPTTTAPSVISFEQSEQRLRTAIEIGNDKVNKE